jgi:excisionase family DNA binding protein
VDAQPLRTETVMLSDREVARMLGIGRTKARELMTAGAIRSVRIGRRRLVPRSEVDAYVAQRLHEGSAND